MSYQLWTSTLTGYRRRGTRMEELREMFGSAVTAGALLEPLQCCSSGWHVAQAKAELRTREFDIAGVRERRGGPLLGFIVREELPNDGHIRDHVRRIDSAHLISEGTSLGEIFSVLRETDRVLVLVGQEVYGIVTRTDLNKPAVRVYLFGLISLLEMHLAFWVRATYAESDWRDVLCVTRVEEAERVLSAQRQRNEGVDLLACLQFCDKRDLLVRSGAWREQFTLGSKTAAKQWLAHVERLRNALAHSQASLSMNHAWPGLVDLVRKTEAFLSAFDEQIEERARKLAPLAPNMW